MFDCGLAFGSHRNVCVVESNVWNFDVFFFCRETLELPTLVDLKESELYTRLVELERHIDFQLSKATIEDKSIRHLSDEVRRRLGLAVRLPVFVTHSSAHGFFVHLESYETNTTPLRIEYLCESTSVVQCQQCGCGNFPRIRRGFSTRPEERNSSSQPSVVYRNLYKSRRHGRWE